MKKATRKLSYLSAFFGGLTLIHPRGGWGAMALWMPKLLAGDWSPFLAIAGGLGALFGLARRDLKAVGAGLFGASVAVRHVVRVTAPHAGFDQAFGPGWSSRIPPELGARLVPNRYTPLLPKPPQVPWRRDVVFGTHLETGDPLFCDIWQPPEEVPPTGLGVVYLHGSGWHFSDKDAGTRPFFRRLAGQGHVIMDVAYTLAPRAHLHDMVADVKRAVAWMKDNGAEYGVNPERIVLMGGSAGAHLALLAAYTPNRAELQPDDVKGDTSVRAVVSYYGLPDLEALDDYTQAHGDLLGGNPWLERVFVATVGPLYRHTRSLPPDRIIANPMDILPRFLGGTRDEVPELYRLGSPIHHVGPHCPPTLLLQGAHDFVGMTPQVRRLQRALREAGVLSIYVEFPNTEHGFDLFFPRWSPAAQAATYDTERFLALMA